MLGLTRCEGLVLHDGRKDFTHGHHQGDFMALLEEENADEFS